MTFGALAAWQAWLLLAGAAALAAWLFLLKPRPPRVVVASLLLWQRVLDETREPTLWERIRRAVSLAVSVAIALALALAVTRPASTAGGGAVGRTLIVLDSSWSMLARTAAGETRWDRAVREARRIAAAAGREVALATTADGLVEGPTTDLPLVEAALDRLAPAGGEGSSWPQVGSVGAVHFITDGALARPLDPAVVVHSVFEPAANVAITAFDVRPASAGDGSAEAYLEIANYAPAAQPVRITLARGTLGSDLDFLSDGRRENQDLTPTLAAGEVLRHVVPLGRGANPAIRARVDAQHNALAIDDEAFAWFEHARPISVLVVGEHTRWLAPLLNESLGVRPTFVAPSAYPSAGTRSDVLILDRWTPPDPPVRPALYIAPREAAWLGPGQVAERAPQWHTIGAHPVVRGVDPFTLAIGSARSYGSADLVPIARSTRGTPLAFAVGSANRRQVLLAFGPDESNLASAPALPVLIGNALEWLARPARSASNRPGLASFDEGISAITGPGGVRAPLTHFNGSTLAVLPTPGFYAVEGGGARSTIAVNAGDPLTSNVARTNLTAASDTRAVSPGQSGRPWWLYLVAAAFALALVEWWTWQRRITV